MDSDPYCMQLSSNRNVCYRSVFYPTIGLLVVLTAVEGCGWRDWEYWIQWPMATRYAGWLSACFPSFCDYLISPLRFTQVVMDKQRLHRPPSMDDLHNLLPIVNPRPMLGCWFVRFLDFFPNWFRFRALDWRKRRDKLAKFVTSCLGQFEMS